MKFPVVALKENRIPRSCERGPVEALVYADAVGSKVEEPAAAWLQACGNGEQCRIPRLMRRVQVGSRFTAFVCWRKMSGHWLPTFFKRRAKAASARHFPQRGFILVSGQVADCEHEKSAIMGLVGASVEWLAAWERSASIVKGSGERRKKRSDRSQPLNGSIAQLRRPQAGTSARGAEWSQRRQGAITARSARWFRQVPVLEMHVKRFIPGRLVDTS